VKPNFKKNISLATTLLLGVSSSAQALETTQDTTINSSLLYYSEEGRVTAIEPQINIINNLNDDNVLSTTISYDSVTGSSPSGEVPTGIVQTVTSSSGQVSTIQGSDKPTKSFNDIRNAVSVSLSHNFNRLFKMNVGLNYSTEQDYSSTGINLGLAMDTEDRLRTWSIGFSNASDDISGTDRLDGVGGIPDPLTNAANKLRRSSTETKDNHEFKIGLTQIISSTSLVEVSYTKSSSSGYHNDPYKLVSLVDSNGVSSASLYESRPDQRDRSIWYGQLIDYIDGNVLKLNYRYFSDNWGIKSHTIGAKYRIKLNDALYVEPHLRYYRQSAADFHQFYLPIANALPQNISADSRLSAFNASTFGIKVGYSTSNYEISGRIESMQQQSDADTSNAPGKLSTYDLFAPINAVIAQVNFTMTF